MKIQNHNLVRYFMSSREACDLTFGMSFLIRTHLIIIAKSDIKQN